MDLRRLNLGNSESSDVTALPREAFQLDADRLKRLQDGLPALSQREFWDPVYQAWKPFFDRYFTSGCDPALTLQYGSYLADKLDLIKPVEGPLHDFYSEILRYNSTTGVILFESYSYQDITQFCELQCKFYVQNAKRLEKQLYNPALYNSTLQTLANKGTWKAFMCALYLYRHCQLEDHVWPPQTVKALEEKLQQWVKEYLTAFDNVKDFLRPNGGVYRWYQDIIRNVISRTWETALVLDGSRRLITPSDVYALEPSIADEMVSYVNVLPVVYDDPFKPITVWDAINSLFGGNAEDEDFLEKAFFAMCVPKSYFKRMRDTLYDFYWVVADSKLTGGLYGSKVTAYSLGECMDETPEYYLQRLYSRGFPEIRKE